MQQQTIKKNKKDNVKKISNTDYDTESVEQTAKQLELEFSEL